MFRCILHNLQLYFNTFTKILVCQVFAVLYIGFSALDNHFSVAFAHDGTAACLSAFPFSIAPLQKLYCIHNMFFVGGCK